VRSATEAISPKPVPSEYWQPTQLLIHASSLATKAGIDEELLIFRLDQRAQKVMRLIYMLNIGIGAVLGRRLRAHLRGYAWSGVTVAVIGHLILGVLTELPTPKGARSKR